MSRAAHATFTTQGVVSTSHKRISIVNEFILFDRSDDSSMYVVLPAMYISLCSKI